MDLHQVVYFLSGDNTTTEILGGREVMSISAYKASQTAFHMEMDQVVHGQEGFVATLMQL